MMNYWAILWIAHIPKLHQNVQFGSISPAPKLRNKARVVAERADVIA